MTPLSFLEQHAPWIKSVQALSREIASPPEDLASTSTKPRAFLVGGAVRDTLLGITSKDADIEVYGVPQERLEQLLSRVFPNNVRVTGKSFAVYTVEDADGNHLDIAMPRRESAIGPKHGDVTVTGDPCMTLEEATSRRDFTMNALMMSPITGEIIDIQNGQKDLEAKVLRVVNPKTFIEDPLRVYRALQFAARFNLTVDENAIRIMKEMVKAGSLNHLSKERITEEIKKLLLSKKPSIGFELAKTLGVIQATYPELARLEETLQDTEYHPEGSVWNHTMMVVDEMAKICKKDEEATEEKRIILMLCALCHDLGKVEMTREENGRMIADGHEKAGEKPTKALFSHWTFGSNIERVVVSAVMNHLIPIEIMREKRAGTLDEKHLQNAVRRMIKTIDPCPADIAIALREADTLGCGGDRTAREEKARNMRETFSRILAQPNFETLAKENLLSGSDVLAHGIPEGPLVGKYIQAVEDLRDTGEIETKEEALKLLEKFIAKKTIIE